ncbi:DUF805 domain-containing protein [Oceaniglobus indicus]|uniref:DUF805 domain-containing protein n=1 Tax=Oceaniglobus indicus TaxID=2047749 RepID=UPI000C19AB4C|nr:DUF805 domain-containing protein [Oceaniglobus indicus]
MTFTQAIRTCMRKYVTFSGRASRPEYWKFILFVIIGTILFGVVDAILFGTTMVETSPGHAALQADGPLAGLFALVTFLPALAAGWRRMHDTGRTGFYLFYPLIVMVGITGALAFFGGLDAVQDGAADIVASAILIPAMIVLAVSPLLVLWWLARPSEPRPNQWGPQP